MKKFVVKSASAGAPFRNTEMVHFESDVLAGVPGDRDVSLELKVVSRLGGNRLDSARICNFSDIGAPDRFQRAPIKLKERFQ